MEAEKIKFLIEELSNAFGPSGFEGEIRGIILKYVNSLADEVKIDKLGNIIATIKRNDNSPTIMLAAHMDEVGLLITSIDENGFLRFHPLGGIDSRILYGQKVIIATSKGRKVHGFIGAKPPHIMTEEERNKVLKVPELFIDIGAKNYDEVLDIGIDIGSVAVFDSKFVELGNGRIMGKAFDDRLGVALIIHLLDKFKDKDYNLVATFTTQEELGLRGARTAAWQVDPDYAIVLEGTTAGDVPGVNEYLQSTKLGGGPAITIADRSIVVNPIMVQVAINAAKQLEIPYQFKRAIVGGTDAGVIHLTREGILTGVISVPCRYIHSPYAIADLNDIDNTIKLVSQMIKNLSEQKAKQE
ncbi:MAG: M42 family metallopeptidase [Candidatus Asgardarchaeia archaeon]